MIGLKGRQGRLRAAWPKQILALFPRLRRVITLTVAKLLTLCYFH
jgi:hypothetical protein